MYSRSAGDKMGQPGEVAAGDSHSRRWQMKQAVLVVGGHVYVLGPCLGAPTRLPLTSCAWLPPGWPPQGPHVPTSRGMGGASITRGGAGGGEGNGRPGGPYLRTGHVLAPCGAPSPCPGEGVGGLGAGGSEKSTRHAHWGQDDAFRCRERGHPPHPPLQGSIQGSLPLCVSSYGSPLTTQSHRGLCWSPF